MRDRGPSDARVGVRRGSLLVSLAAASALVSLAGCLGAGRTPSEEDARLDPARKGSEYETVAASGAWCWFADPRAVRVGAPPAGGERTFAGWVTGDGSVAVAEINNATGEVRSTVIHERLQRDDHDNPALMLRADGRIMAFYSGHGGPDMFLRVSERPFDPSSWGRGGRSGSTRRGAATPIRTP